MILSSIYLQYMPFSCQSRPIRCSAALRTPILVPQGPSKRLPSSPYERVGGRLKAVLQTGEQHWQMVHGSVC